jgi:hypothetical protein
MPTQDEQKYGAEALNHLVDGCVILGILGILTWGFVRICELLIKKC